MGAMTPLFAAQVYGGRYLNDEEITGMLIATLFAGQHTSSITSSWTGLTMIRDQVKDHVMTQRSAQKAGPSCILHSYPTEAAPFSYLLERAHNDRGSDEDIHR